MNKRKNTYLSIIVIIYPYNRNLAIINLYIMKKKGNIKWNDQQKGNKLIFHLLKKKYIDKGK